MCARGIGMNTKLIFALYLLFSSFNTPLDTIRLEIFDRITTPISVYTWQLVRWSDAMPLCLIEVHHAGLPTGTEIYTQCGAERYQNWLNTPPCQAASVGGETTTCAGVYLRLISETSANGEAPEQESDPNTSRHDLPMPQAWLNIEGCEVRGQGYHCSQAPILTIHAEEPLPEEHITLIAGDFAATPFVCENAYCGVELSATDPLGTPMNLYIQLSRVGEPTSYV